MCSMYTKQRSMPRGAKVVSYFREGRSPTFRVKARGERLIIALVPIPHCLVSIPILSLSTLTVLEHLNLPSLPSPRPCPSRAPQITHRKERLSGLAGDKFSFIQSPVKWAWLPSVSAIPRGERRAGVGGRALNLSPRHHKGCPSGRKPSSSPSIALTVSVSLDLEESLSHEFKVCWDL